MRTCTPYRRRGPTYYLECEPAMPGDMAPDHTHCFDLAALDRLLGRSTRRRPCPSAAAGCA